MIDSCLILFQFCVNSLRDECKEFFAIHGRDGRDLRAPARFPCYYSPEKNDSVVTKFNRAKVVFEFALSAAVPGALFVFSCSCLVLCTRVMPLFSYIHSRSITLNHTFHSNWNRLSASAQMLTCKFWDSVVLPNRRWKRSTLKLSCNKVSRRAIETGKTWWEITTWSPKRSRRSTT